MGMCTAEKYVKMGSHSTVMVDDLKSGCPTYSESTK